jgi:serine/threonine-protein kinase
MGEVWLAEHVELRAEVVVKLLNPSLSDREDLSDRIRLEAQALARLRHPNIVSVLDAGRTVAGYPFIVMERLRGKTLAAELEVRPVLPVTEALGIARQVLAGLSAAHAVGIVHRDVKATNLFLCDSTQEGDRADGGRFIKIIDFGIAKIVAQPPGPALQPLRFPTEEGTVLGTPVALSPEQAMGRTVDHRSDLYAVGLLLYRLVAGEHAFGKVRGPALVASYAARTPVPPSQVAPQPLHAELDALVLKALRTKPDERFQSAGDFSGEIDRVERLLTEGLPRSQSHRAAQGVFEARSSERRFADAASAKPTFAIDSATVPRLIEQLAGADPDDEDALAFEAKTVESPMRISDSLEIPVHLGTEQLSTNEVALFNAGVREQRGPPLRTDEVTVTRTADPIPGSHERRGTFLNRRFILVAATTAIIVAVLLAALLQR